MAKIRLTQDFREFLNLLNSEKIEYLLIGGYAVGLYGVERPTKDMDVWISVSDDNLDKFIEVLGKFGFQKSQFKRADFKGDQSVFRMGLPPNRLEVLTRISGAEFADCFPRRVQMDVDGIPVPVIDVRDLIRNKVASGRDRDRDDVKKLQKWHKAE